MEATTDSILVLDADLQNGLAVVRSLGQRGIRVTAGASTRISLGGLSKYSNRTYHYPEPSVDTAAFIDNLEAYLRRTDHSFVLPMRDKTTLLLSKEKERLEATGTGVAVEDWERFYPVFDKGLLHEILASSKIPVPNTYRPDSISEIRQVAREVSYPAIIKPRSKSYFDGNGGMQVYQVGDENYVGNEDELVTMFRSIIDTHPAFREYLPIVQDVIPGMTTTTVGFAVDGEIKAHVQERRLRTTPVSGGISTKLASIERPRMLAIAKRALQKVEWTGPFMVEFMERSDGSHVLIEINGRYWGSLPFAITCGVDIPWIHFCHLRGDNVGTTEGYRTGVIQRRLLYWDVRWLWEHLQNGNLRAVGPFLTDFISARHTFFYPDDPYPTFWAAFRGPSLAIRAGLQALAGYVPSLSEK